MQNPRKYGIKKHGEFTLSNFHLLLTKPKLPAKGTSTGVNNFHLNSIFRFENSIRYGECLFFSFLFI